MTRHILIISDGRPGHFRQSEAIALALSRKSAASTEWIEVATRPKPWPRLARRFGSGALMPPTAVMRLAYSTWSLPKQRPDLIISAGGATLAANLAMARLYGAPNVFSGSLRTARADGFSAVLIPYEDHAGLANHIVLPKPSSVDPDEMRVVRPVNAISSKEEPPLTGGLLVGGPSGSHTFSDAEWRFLLDLPTGEAGAGFRWAITNSPRTPETVSDRLTQLASQSGGRISFVDFRTAGPGSVNKILSDSDFVLCTEDSSSMVVEAVCAQRPTLALQPGDRRMNAAESTMFESLARRHLIGQVPLGPELGHGLVAALERLEPMKTNHLDDLAEAVEAAVAR